MRFMTFCLLAVCVVFMTNDVLSKPLEAYISEAEARQQTGNLAQAETIMEEALKEYPDNPTIMGYLGGYLIMQAGQTQDMNKAGELAMRSLQILDSALESDPGNPIALFYRGITGVNAPEFLGRLDQGVGDLESFISIYQRNPDALSESLFTGALDNLGTGYDKQGDWEKAYETWSEILNIAPGTPMAEQIEQRLQNYLMSEEQQVNSTRILVEGNPEIGALREKLDNDPNNPDLLYELALAYGAEAEKGYDERIYEDTTFRTNLAFEMVNLLDRAIKLAPENMEIALTCGEVCVMMPFFVNRLDNGIEHLNKVINSDAPVSAKAEARFWLGYAYQKKATTEWIKVISEYPDTEAAELSFEWMTPTVQQFDRSEHPGPVVAIDFVLGFRDELEPQTAVWIEDAQGNFVKTVYVSGFSGYAKEQQIDLPVWAESSKFVDTDGVTGASIDLGHHLYVWDLNDSSGNRVKPGVYTVKIETCYWPSMQYQTVSTSITIGDEEAGSTVEKGNFIPYMKAAYYP